MDEIIMRRLKHLQWLEEKHERDFQEGISGEDPTVKQQLETPEDETSTQTERGQGNADRSSRRDTLPKDWRKEHWKTLQSMASDYTGVSVANKQQAVRVLETYEADSTLPPAA